jgi:hypothetical protein
MGLFLVEFSPQGEINQVLETLRNAISGVGPELIEVQVTADASHVFAILEAANAGGVKESLANAGFEFDGIAPVRLVGADLEHIKQSRPPTGYLVEWDIPEGITMDAYLARKKEKSPLYAQVPETTFQRTYVREDMLKCLCFYDAPDEEAVVRAREVVSTPIDRLHKLDTSLGD